VRYDHGCLRQQGDCAYKKKQGDCAVMGRGLFCQFDKILHYQQTILALTNITYKLNNNFTYVSLLLSAILPINEIISPMFPFFLQMLFFH
jgi:hypothetical protein